MTNGLAETYVKVTKAVEALIAEYAENDRDQIAGLIIRAAFLTLPDRKRAQKAESLRIEFGSER